MSGEETSQAVKQIHERQTAVFTRLDTQDRTLNEIRNALVGNDQLGQKGLVERIKHVEAHVTKMENLKIKISGAVIVLSALGTALGQKFIALFGNTK